MGNLINGAKVGGIVRTHYRWQYFYVHNIHNDEMYLSGVGHDGNVFNKSADFRALEVVPENEEYLFYDMLEKYRLKLDLNKGVQRI